MRAIICRAMFRKVSSGEEIWQKACLVKGKIYNPLPDLGGYVQVTDWELFTGLKDKNGVEIYEGDIMQWEWGDGSVTNEVVAFEDGCFWLGDQAFIDIKLPNYEIIGNAHENPTLLEGD